MHPDVPAVAGPDQTRISTRVIFTQSAGHWVYGLIRIAIAGVFIGSGATKLLDPRSFTLIISAYGLLPDLLVWPMALILAGAEVLAGLGLLFDQRWPLGVITGLLILFMLILSYGLWLGLDVECGCFGPQDLEGRAYHGLRPALYRDALMLAGTGFLYYWRFRQSGRPRRLSFVSIIFNGWR
jgi:uncharacterized membrane protein YphA (DoxX/SURF4 family)